MQSCQMNFDLYFIGLKRKKQKKKKEKEKGKENSKKTKKPGPDPYPSEPIRGPVLPGVEPDKGRVFENKPVLPYLSNPRTRTTRVRANSPPARV